MLTRKESRNAAIAYLVWCEATKAEWNITLAELTDRARTYFNDPSISLNVVRGICSTRSKGEKTWLNLLRTTSACKWSTGDAV